MEKIKFGVIGLGERGYSTTVGNLAKLDEVSVVAVCDVYEDRIQKIADKLEENTGLRPTGYTDYRELLKQNLDAVYVASSWDTHVEISIDAMKARVPVAMEVGGAYTIDSLWNLVHTYEETKTPLMFMENCCFDRAELLATSMVRNGLLGEIVHAHGCYAHCLHKEIAGGHINRHYRLDNYLRRNGENYPTHELGPIAKVLNINRGNRMVSMVSVSSRATGMEAYIRDHAEKYPELIGKRFAQGDIVNTIITCADGSTISLRLDTTLPRFYAREFTLHGTKGLYEQNNNIVYLEGDPEEGIWTYDHMVKHGNNAEEYAKQYLPSVWSELTEEQLKTGHGGMDTLQWVAFIQALRNGEEMPIDVYDAASWMSITALSEASIATGGMPQAIPDFTSGRWVTRSPMDVVPMP